MSFIVIEWVDGSGKATQTKLLVQNLKNLWKKVENISFPSYGEKSAYFVEQFLDGQYGNMKDVDSQIASMFYILDRFGQKNSLLEKIKNSDYLISDRYSISNFIHRWTNFLELGDEKWMKEFFDWLYDMEFVKAGLPKPDKIFFLSLSLESIKKLMISKQKENRQFISEKQWGLDIAEKDIRHQELSLKIWKEILPKYFPNYIVIDCEDETWNILSPEEISKKILNNL